MPNPELQVQIGAKITDLERELAKARKSLKKLGDTTDKQSKRIKKSTSGISKSIKNLVGVIGAVAVLQFGARMIKDLTVLAKQMEGDSRRAAIVFGDSLAFVTREAEKNAIALGLTRKEYIAAAAATQDLLIPLGFQRKEASRLSVELTNLSGVLSNWVGGQKDAREVSEILTKTILGETEQIKTLGIKIDQTSKSFNQRIKQLQITNNLTLEQAKALEILNQITDKSADAQTEFANATKSLSLQEAEANALFREQSEILADDIIPLYIEWLNLKRGFVKGFGDFSLVLKSELSFFEKFNALTGLGIIVGEKSAAVIAERIRQERKREKLLKDAIGITQKYNKENQISIASEKLKERFTKKTNEQLDNQIRIIEKLLGMGKLVIETTGETEQSFLDEIKALKKLQLTTADTTTKWLAFEKQIKAVQRALNALKGGVTKQQTAISTTVAGFQPLEETTKDKQGRTIPNADEALVQVDDVSKRVTDAQAATMLALHDFNMAANDIINGSIAETFASLGSVIGDALASGGNVLQAAGSALLGGLGMILTDLGKMAIQIGVGLIAVKLALKTLNPVVAIAAGVALVALGSIFSKGASNIADGIGGSGGGFAGSTGGGGSSRGTQSSINNVSQSGSGGTYVFEIQGTKLIGVLQNTLRRNSALGGNLDLLTT